MIDTSGIPLESIVRSLVDRLAPRRVVLFGSRARGDAHAESDVDLLVEVDGRIPRAEQDRIAQALLPERPGRLDLKLVTPDQVERQRDDVGTLVYVIEREGRELYRRADVRPRPPASRVSEGPVPPSRDAWIAKADGDFRMIELAMAAADAPWDAVCFHAQQGAEKYLKALLVDRFVHPPRSHSLVELLEVARAHGTDPGDVDAECALLAPYAVDTRYPTADLAADETREAAHAARDAASRIRDAVRRLLRPVDAL